MTTGNQFAALFKDETTVSSKSSYENAFPSLGKEKKLCSKHPYKSDLESDFKTEVIHRSSGKKTQTKIILGHRSYEDELREKYPYYKQKDMSSHSANAEKLAVSLVKSRMCISVDKNEKCQNGDNCRFAHSLDDLRISDCLFEQKCRFVRMSNGELINNGEKVCLHKHPHENTNTFMRRTGLDRYKCTNKVSLSNTDSSKEIVTHCSNTDSSKEIVTHCSNTDSSKELVTHSSNKIEPPSSKTFIDASTNQMLVIRVPKELACQALEIAMKSGNTHIQIDIVK
jgi:hypothetical protein